MGQTNRHIRSEVIDSFVIRNSRCLNFKCFQENDNINTEKHLQN